MDIWSLFLALLLGVIITGAECKLNEGKESEGEESAEKGGERGRVINAPGNSTSLIIG